jgi:uncharacterized membrane protein
MAWLAAGAVSGSLTDYGIEDDYMRELAESFTPGTAALFVLVKEVTADRCCRRSRPSAARC